MAKPNAADVFKEIIDLTEKTTALMEKFGECDPADREAVLIADFEGEVQKIGERGDISIRLIRTAEMLTTVDSEKVAEVLGKTLDHDNLDVRMISGDVLMHLAEEGLDAIMPAVDTVLKKAGVGAEEMPFILAELDEPEVPKVLERFLASQNGNVVAAALEAMAEVGDDDVIPAIQKLVGDTREVSIEEGPGESDKTTVGQLAKDALELLENDE